MSVLQFGCRIFDGMCRAALVAVLALSAVTSVSAAEVTDFAKMFTVTVPAGLADEPLSDFPLLVRLESSIQDFDYADFHQNGADLLVTDTEDRPLPYELENWDTNGESRLWVQVPSVAEGTTIRVYYGTTATVDEVDGMWSGYAGVWHLNEAGDGAVTVLDVTTNALSGVCHETSAAVLGGVLGGARYITSNTDNNPGFNSGITVDLSDAAKKGAVNGLVPTFTASFWFRPQVEMANYEYLMSRKMTDASNTWGVQFGKEAGRTFSQLRIYGADANKFANTATTGSAGTEGVTIAEGGSNEWHRLDCVWSANARYALYFDGNLVAEGPLSGNLAAANVTDNNLSIGGALKPTNGKDKGGRGFRGEMDEVRLRYGASTAARIAAEYRQESGTLTAVCGEVGLVDAGAPTVSAPSIVRNADGSFTVSIVVSDNDAASVKCLVGNAEFAMTSAVATLPKTYAATLSGLASDTTFTYAVQAMSTGGDTLNRSGSETFYTGDLSVAKVQDGDEDGLVPGVFRISRTGDDALALPVSFTLGGTAVEGRSYQLLEKTATIPAGAAYVDVEIRPLIDQTTTNALTVVLTLESGLYGIASDASSATLSIANLFLNDDFNTWIASDAGLASDGANWSFGHAPLATEHVLFDGRFSNADCEWDEAATHEVAAWTQNNGYAGKVTLRTVFPGKGAFMTLVVSGAMTIDAGFLTHPQSRDRTDNVRSSQGFDFLADLLANETYRLRIDAGSLHVGAGGVLDARGKGYLLSGASSQCATCSHGGRLNADSPRCYGDPREPVDIGLPHRFYTSKQNNGAGGGAIYVTVRGAAVVDGTIRADPWDVSEANDSGQHVGAFGAAGSIFLRADTLTGCGRITADGLGQSDYGIVPTVGNPENNFKGTGGRVAIVTRVPVDRSTFASISAEGRWMGAAGASWTARFGGGSGTVVFRDETRPNGLLVIAQDDAAVAPTLLGDDFPTFWRCPSVTAEGDWTFDAIEFGHRGFLRIPVGTTLTLPGGLASCTGTVSSIDDVGGLRYEGGTLHIGSGDQTISGNWMFVPWTNFVFQGSVVVTNGAAIGFHPLTDNIDRGAGPAALPICSAEIRGDLTVAADSHLRAVDCGIVKSPATNENGFATPLFGSYSHGGRSISLGRDPDGNPVSQAYDSVFDPRLPGCAPTSIVGRKCGGAIRLAVDGTLTLDGLAMVSGTPEARVNSGWAGGAGGALSLSAGRFAGTGTIKASGGNYDNYGGPGGRVAIRLSAPGADFADFTGVLYASGGCWWKGFGDVCDSSAGTIYLETAADGDKGGTIRIAMDPLNIAYLVTDLKSKHVTTNTTEMVSLGYGGDEIKAYKKVRYIIENYGRAAVNTDFRAQSVTLADGTAALDLEGHRLTLRDFFWVTDSGGSVVTNKLRSGTYSYNSLKSIVGDSIEDTSDGQSGSVVIQHGNLVLTLR